MKLKLSLQRSGAAPIDVAVTADAITTVGDLAAYLAGADRTASVHPVGLDQLTLGLVGSTVRALDPRANLSDSGLSSGATVTITRATQAYQDRERGAAAVVSIVGGRDAGREFPIPAGTSIVGRESGCEIRLSDPLVSRQHARITVTDVVEIVDLGSSNGLQVGSGVAQRATMYPGATVTVGETQLTARLIAAPRIGSESGSVSFIRSPRLDPVYEGVETSAPEPPERPKLQRFPALTVLASLLMGAVLFLVTRSLYSLLFIALSPLLVMATAIESRFEARSEFRTAVRQFREDLRDLIADATKLAAREVFGRAREHPSAAEAVDAARTAGPLLWTRRPGERGFAEFRLGMGRQPARNRIKISDANRAPRYLQKELSEAVAPFSSVEPVPIVAFPLTHGAIGIAGLREPALGAARSIVVQAATLHSPAELVIAGIASSRTARDWDWMKWLPHTSSGHSPVNTRLLASDESSATRLVSELENLVDEREAAAQTPSARARPGADNVVLVLVEHDAPVEHNRLVGLAETGWRHGVFLLWLTSDHAELPAACRNFVDVGLPTDDGASAAGFVHSAERVMPLAVDVVDADSAMAVARRLSPLLDVGARLEDDSDLPRSTSLLGLIGPELATIPETVIERWTENSSVLTGPFAPANGVRREGSLRAVVGQSAGEKHVLDLRSDGPHALVGGTTGAGKSELLQSWILAMAAAHSPQRLSFLLVDYKGGSAFRECVDLPHTVGLVTDLSPHLVRRALTSLAAELRHREEILARHAAKDLISLQKQGFIDAPPSLVIVVDEFAALVTDVPEFIDGVVDVAQRGRSLGLHLILATQRPSGVIKESLRANTNLRLALRVADEHDSTDVLGAPDAAYFDQSIPGRAVSKTGPGRLVHFQTGYAGGITTDQPPIPEILVEELVFGPGRSWELAEALPIPTFDDDASDIKRLVRSISEASLMAALPAPRKPWLPELRDVYDLADRLVVPSPRVDTELVFGVRDDPEKQAQPTAAFFPDRDGNLAVYGTGGSGKSTLLRSIAVAAGFTIRGGPCHVYGIDFGARGLAMLEELPHVGSIIVGTDHERITRLLEQIRALVDERAVRYSRVSADTITEYRRLADAPDEPRILLLVDGISAFRHAYEAIDRTRWFDTFLSIATDGRPVGVHVVVSCEQRSGMPAGLASSVQRRIVLRMAAPDDYTMLDTPIDVLTPDSPPGRGLVGNFEMQVAVLGGSSDGQAQAAAVQAFADSMRRSGASTAPAVRRLPDRVFLDELPAAVGGLPVIGLSGATLLPATMTPRGSFLIAGPRGSGRTTTLHTVLRALHRGHPSMRRYYLGQRRSPLAHLDLWTQAATDVDGVAELARELTASLAQWRNESSVASTTVFIEDVGDFVGGPADAALQDLARACLNADQLLIVDGETSELTSSYGLLGSIKASRSGISLQPGDGDGQMLYRSDFPRLSRAQLPPGRAICVRFGKTELIQVALPDAMPAISRPPMTALAVDGELSPR